MEQKKLIGYMRVSSREQNEDRQRIALLENGVPESTVTLWNRNVNHSDFLYHRLGIGDIPFQVEIAIPKERFTLINDSLSEKPRMIRDSYQMLHDVPICLNLLKHRRIGIVGGEKKHGSVSVMHDLVAQIAMSNCYTDVKMVFIYDVSEDASTDWEYLKWFPHVWSEDKKTRYIAKNKTEAGDVLYEITQNLRKRTEMEQERNNRDRIILPHYVLFIAEPELLEGELISKYIYDEAENSGITTFFLTDDYDKLPNECDFIIF